VTFIETLGRGGFGAVYLADVRGEDNFVQRIAVKLLNENMGEDADIVGRQRDEARILAQLNHDHIVKVFDLSEIHGRPAVFMEYVAGVDAGRLLQGGGVSARAALEIAGAVASALEAAWSTASPITGRPLHVVHRDIKPSNILISTHGGVKVLDFGIARADMVREGQTRTHQLGTARYMAPEQWLGGPIGSAVDIYALGITMLELLSGTWIDRLPLMVDRFDSARAHTIQQVRDPRWGGVWWRDLSGLLSAMLSRDPADRPGAQEVEGILLDLSESVGGESLGRLARRRIPELMARRSKRNAEAPLISVTDTWHHTAPEPSILTGSKQTIPMPKRTGPEPAGHPLHWGVLAFGMVIAVGWMFWGWLGPADSDAPGVDRTPAMSAPAGESSPGPAPMPVAVEGEQAAEDKRERVRVAGDVVRIRIDSVPPGARVSMDGVRLGRTPLEDIEVGLGAHDIRVRLGKDRGQRRIEVRAGGPSRYTWHQDQGQWSSGY
jgi:serine/threonine-protein kinase